MTISAVLINHNGGSTILRTIQSLLDQGLVWDQIVLVDNASIDDSVEKVQQVYPLVQVEKLGANLGLPQARNIGLSKIQSDLVLFMDDDVFLTPKSVQYMIFAMQETGASVVCPRILLHPENETVQCDGAFIHFAGVLSLRHSFEKAALHAPSRTMTTGFIGASLLFDANYLKELGGFDEDYFFYFEDLEMSFRLVALGRKICCEERAVALHERGAGTANLSFRGQGTYPVKRAYYSLRHRWLTILIHYQIWSLILLSPALILYEAAAFIEAVRRGWLEVYLRAVLSLVRGWSTILKRRRHWGAKRKVSDRNILSGGALPFSRGFVEPSKAKLIQVLDLALDSYWKAVKQWL